MNGDLSKLFSFPGGPIGFAVGAVFAAPTTDSRDNDNFISLSATRAVALHHLQLVRAAVIDFSSHFRRAAGTRNLIALKA